MKILLTGSSGYISGFIIDRFKNRYEIIKADMNDAADVYLDLEAVENFNFELLNDVEYVIFPAAISSPDLCQKDFARCWKINVAGTGAFITEALNRGCKVLFFSSDAVFRNHPDKVFDEDSVTDACTAYGEMKKAIEDRFKMCKGFKAIRLSYVVSPKDKFTKYALHCMETGETCEVYDPFYRNCITINDVLDSIDYLLSNWKEYEPVFLNIAGKDLIGREDIVKELNRIYGDRISYKVVYPGDEFYKCRPKQTQMKSLYLQKLNILPDDPFSTKMDHEFKNTL